MTQGWIGRATVVLLSVVTAAFAGAAGGTAGEHDRAQRTSVVTTELLRLEVPAGWSAQPHDDRAGVTVTGQGAVLDVTLMPTVLFGGLFLDVPADATAETIADVVVPMFSPLNGVIADDARIVDLGDERPAVVVPARVERGPRHGADRLRPAGGPQLGPNAVGEVVLFPADAGVLAVAALHTRGDARPVRNGARSILASLELTATADDVLAVLDPPLDELPER